MKKILLLLILAISTMSLPACSTMQDSETWYETRKLYFTYVNKPATVKYDDIANISEIEYILSSSLMKVDSQLTAFQNNLAQLSLPPHDAELQNFFRNFPWISGIALINPEGTVTGAFPEQYGKNIDFSALLITPEGRSERDTRVAVHEDPNGPEILVGRPAFDNDGNFVGVFIVYFDIRSLFAYVELDPSIFAFAGNTPLWLGDYLISETPVAEANFDELTSSDTSGTLRNSYGEALWINRYLYNQPLIFAIMSH